MAQAITDWRKLTREVARTEVHTFSQPNCYLCRAAGVPLYENFKDRLFYAPGSWSLRRCSKAACGLVWLDPQPEVGDIPKLYFQYYTGAVAKNTSPLRQRIKHFLLAGALGYGATGSQAIHLLQRCLGLVPSLQEMAAATVMYLPSDWRGRVLDVGCGNGILLRNLHALGWQVFGVDPDPSAVAATNELLGPVARVGNVESFDDKFDVVTMNHVIEHLPDPVETLRQCFSRLRPGGRLVVQTPNVESWGARVFGRAWVAWDPPRHLYLFSPVTLARVAEEAGFTVDQVRTTARAAHFTWTVSRAIRREGWAHDTLVRGRAGLLDSIASAAFQLLESFRDKRSGEEVVLVARRS